jgi:hypothetical protein
MTTDEALKTDTYYKCKKCGDEIFWNTHKKYTACKCGALAVDGCEDYVRLIGNKEDRETITK